MSADYAIQLSSFVGRFRHELETAGWPILSEARSDEWRFASQEDIPPFAVKMAWGGPGLLTENQQRLLHSLRAFGRIRMSDYKKPDGTQFSRCELVIHDMTSQPKPAVMFHATPSERVNDILCEGLRPSRFTQRSTTNFPDAERWIHLTVNVADALKWLNNPKNRKHLPAGEYTLIQVSTQEIGELFADPYSDFGFVTEVDAIAPARLEVLQTVAVGSVCENVLA